MATERKYTVSEIDQMREYVEKLLSPMTWVSRTHAYGEPYGKNERKRDVERRLRTYMLNGCDPEELKLQLAVMLGLEEQQRMSFTGEE